MSSSPAKYKSSHSHEHHHHHSPSSSGHSSSASKTTLILPSHIRIQDNAKLLPRYSVALSKPHDEGLPADELDGIQLELETLLSSVALRYRTLKLQYEHLEDRKHQKKGLERENEKASSPSISGKRKREVKKSSTKDTILHRQHAKHPKIMNTSSKSPAHLHHTDQSGNDDVVVDNAQTIHGHNHPYTIPKPMLLKNDVPYKFWLSVEPYCIPITQEDIKLLDDLIDEYNEPLVPSIPELGPHYSIRWASEDLHDDQETNSNTPTKFSKCSNSASADANESPKKSNDTKKIMGSGVCGGLTQRLVSGFLEDNTETQTDLTPCIDVTSRGGDSCTENNTSSANQAQTSSVASLMNNGIDVENQLKNELFELGILESIDLEKNKEDEVLNEIIRVRNELQAISEFNCDELKLLKTAVTREMKRQEIKRKIDCIDKEIIEAQKRVLAAKQKRRPLTNQERNDIFRLVEEQKRLSDQLESMPIPGFDFVVHPTEIASTSTASNNSLNA